MNPYWLALSYLDGKGVGPATAGKWLDAFGDPEEIFRASPADLKSTGASDKAVAALVGFREWDKVEEAGNAIELTGARAVTRADPEYPHTLLQAEHPPIVLFVLGEIRPEDSLAVCVIGTRKPTDYGLRVARTLSRQIADCGVAVVSGLARGIDAAAHEGALKSAKGRTIAVLGCGIDRIYPAENAPLAREIAGRGAVVTEFFPGTEPKAEHFPRRNRVIAGLSNGVLVIEAGDKSGTMITVDYAVKQGKPVFGVPGPIDSPSSQGVHRLLRDGAIPVFDAMDVLENLLPEFRRRERLPAPPGLDLESWKKSLGLTGDAYHVLEALSLDPRHVDELATSVSLPAQRLLTVLLELELRGFVAEKPGKYYVLKPEQQ